MKMVDFCGIGGWMRGEYEEGMKRLSVGWFAGNTCWCDSFTHCPAGTELAWFACFYRLVYLHPNKASHFRFIVSKDQYYYILRYHPSLFFPLSLFLSRLWPGSSLDHYHLPPSLSLSLWLFIIFLFVVFPPPSVDMLAQFANLIICFATSTTWTIDFILEI